MASSNSLTVLQAAIKIGKHPNTIKNWIKAGMPAKKEYGKLIILESDLTEWNEKMKNR